LILFVENHNDDAPTGIYFEKILQHPLYRQYPRRCFVHSGLDNVIPRLPGVFPSIERRWFIQSQTRSGSYLNAKNPYLAYEPTNKSVGTRWLACFVGCVGNIRTRKRLMEIEDERFVIKDMTREFVMAAKMGDEMSLNSMKRQYVDVLRESLFALCPRGRGASSIRLFEAMEIGRAPVILSDQWVPPAGPDWKTFTIRVRESSVSLLGQILRDHEHEAHEQGRTARHAWREFFAEDVLFHHVTEACLDIVNTRRRCMPLSKGLIYIQFLRPHHLRRLARRVKCDIRSGLTRDWR